MRKREETSITLENIDDIDFDVDAFLKEIDSDDTEIEWSVKFKRKMNRLFRERVGSKRAMHPEVDNAYERIRSKIIYNFYRITDKIKKKCKKAADSKTK